MDSFVHRIDALMAAAGAAVGWFFGGLDGFFYALLALSVADYITGVMKAWLKKELSSAIGAKGIFQKVCIFILVGVVHVLDAEFLGHGDVLREAVIFFYIANEGLSVLENVVELGVPVPEFLKERLLQIHGSGGKNESGVR